MPWIVIFLALAAGLMNPVQSATNAQLNKLLAQPIWAGIAVYACGLAGLLVTQCFVREPLPSIAAVSWWAWMGGIISIASTMAGLLFAQKLGAGLFTAISLTAALICSIALDRFGALGLKPHDLSGSRIAGACLLVAGIWFIARG